jgi:hypothetical protein
VPIRTGVNAVKLREPALTAKSLFDTSPLLVPRVSDLNSTVPAPTDENRPFPCGVELIVSRDPAPTFALIPELNETNPPARVPPPTDVIEDNSLKINTFPELTYTVEPFTARVPE